MRKLANFSKSTLYVNDSFTMWKFLDFCLIQILREINISDSWVSKPAILTILEALNFNFFAFLHF